MTYFSFPAATWELLPCHLNQSPSRQSMNTPRLFLINLARHSINLHYYLLGSDCLHTVMNDPRHGLSWLNGHAIYRLCLVLNHSTRNSTSRNLDQGQPAHPRPLPRCSCPGSSCPYTIICPPEGNTCLTEDLLTLLYWPGSVICILPAPQERQAPADTAATPLTFQTFALHDLPLPCP